MIVVGFDRREFECALEACAEEVECVDVGCGCAGGGGGVEVFATYADLGVSEGFSEQMEGRACRFASGISNIAEVRLDDVHLRK